MKTVQPEFPELFQLMGGYFHQDMDLEYETIPEAISAYAHLSDDTTKASLEAEMERFLRIYEGHLEEEFKRRYWQEVNLDYLKQTVPEFFDMVHSILQNPNDYRKFE